MTRDIVKTSISRYSTYRGNRITISMRRIESCKPPFDAFSNIHNISSSFSCSQAFIVHTFTMLQVVVEMNNSKDILSLQQLLPSTSTGSGQIHRVSTYRPSIWRKLFLHDDNGIEKYRDIDTIYRTCPVKRQ